MSIFRLEERRSLPSALARVVGRSAQVVVVVAVIVVPFGYAITGHHHDVAMGAIAGLMVGVGLHLRVGARSGRSVGILIGSAVGVATALIAGLVPGDPWGFLLAPLLALAIALVDRLGAAPLTGYREAAAEAATLSSLIGLGFGVLFWREGVVPLVGSLCLAPQTALMAGFFGQNREGRRYARPPLWLLLPALAVFALIVVITMSEQSGRPSVPDALASAAILAVGAPVAVFLSARAFAGWLRPRLRVYLMLADYLRVMWVPVGGFSVGYLAIILVFAGFFGMLERFVPGSFAGASGASVFDWISFSFYSAVADAYTAITPNSLPARLLVGARLVLSVSWAVVVFAAVMSAIQPRLDRIARRNAANAD